MEDSTLILLGAAGVAAYFLWQDYSQASTALAAANPTTLPATCTAANPCNASVVPTSAVTPPSTGPGGMTLPTSAVTPPSTGSGGMTQAQQDAMSAAYQARGMTQAQQDAMSAAYQAQSKITLDYIASVQAGCPANSVLFDGKKATCSTSPIGTCPSAPYPGYQASGPADFGIQFVAPYAGLSWCQPQPQ